MNEDNKCKRNAFNKVTRETRSTAGKETFKEIKEDFK